MYINNKKALAALIFRSFALILSIAAITVHMLVNSVLSSGFMVKHNLAYFTLQTNIFSGLIFAWLVFRALQGLFETGSLKLTQAPHSLHLACTLYISITMLGYWLALAPLTGIPRRPALLWDTLLLHSLAPLAAICDYLLFAPHGGLKRREIFKWLVYPVLYLISVIIISRLIREPYYTVNLGGKSVELLYPYPFLEPQIIGIGGFIAVTALLLAVFLLLALLFIFIDGRLGKRQKGTELSGSGTKAP